MLQPLKDAYNYYETKKLEEDLAKDDIDRNKVICLFFVVVFTSLSLCGKFSVNIIVLH